MARRTDVRLLNVSSTATCLAYRTPIKFGGRVVTEAVLFDVTVEVETRDGRCAVGSSSMPLGNAWAWPSVRLSGDITLAAMLNFGRRAVLAASRYSGLGHPLEIFADLAVDHSALAAEAETAATLSEPVPRLAQLVAASPLDAALHDAFGKALGRNAYNLLGAEFVGADLSEHLGPEFAGEYLDRYTLRAPRPRLPLYHLVGALDPLSPADVSRPVADGLPESLDEWIRCDGLTHLKIKLNGDDLRWDIERVVEIERVANDVQHDRGCRQWHYSLDFNERCANVDYVLAFLEGISHRAPAAFDRVQYIEQPTHRDLRAAGNQPMHAAARIKPVVIDESLVDYESLLLARELGYSGVALKACKGHGEALRMAAAALKFGMFLCVQDLTCPGASFLHSASLAARVPGVAGIEANARQYCPAGNQGWSDRFPTMFRLDQGTVETAVLDGPGLGF